MIKSVSKQRIASISLLLLLVPFLFTNTATAAPAQEIDAKVDATLKIFRCPGSWCRSVSQCSQRRAGVSQYFQGRRSCWW